MTEKVYIKCCETTEPDLNDVEFDSFCQPRNLLFKPEFNQLVLCNRPLKLQFDVIFICLFSVCLGTNDRSSSEILIDLADLESGTPSPLRHGLTPPQHSESLPADLLTLTSLIGAQPSSSNTSSGSSSFQTSPPSSQLPSSMSLLDEELGSFGK